VARDPGSFVPLAERIGPYLKSRFARWEDPGLARPLAPQGPDPHADKEGSAVGWRRARVVIPVTFGLVLVSVPTAFTVFPGIADWSRSIRIAIVVFWVLFAVVGAFLTARADEKLQKAIYSDQQALIRAEHRAAIRDQFNGMLVPGVGGLPDSYHLTVYAPTPDHKFLVPVHPACLGYWDSAIFQTGVGATGKAWEDPSGVFVALASRVSHDVHGLSVSQQRRYKLFKTVAAVVIVNEGQPVGVLTAASRDKGVIFGAEDEVGEFRTRTRPLWALLFGPSEEAVTPKSEDGVAILKDLAAAIAWMVPEAVRWMMPERTTDDTRSFGKR
jgi:hypothetical protein